MHVKYCAAGLLGGLAVAVAGAQEREDRTLLPPAQMTAIWCRISSSVRRRSIRVIFAKRR